MNQTDKEEFRQAVLRLLEKTPKDDPAFIFIILISAAITVGQLTDAPREDLEILFECCLNKAYHS